ncbi:MULTISPECIES: (2Fe-2S)-binding protein [unclassified Bacillus (in: firmicutes)]|uniref:(2Fe-2S)-binding protein n=1 Tax=unclassified Bacillus (in: firmicutes) TaxID=185979 RepID=UPI0008E9B064|nr:MULTISPECIES: (2Fe-2S)-binding protein [unclassified Bacillus (in: firmicutes)]SFA69688.1 sarcosine oxidase subunit alpha [Bacillus sp. UNCCL13]SFQ59018.1 sarcosine oxidase subunit alpha [Bacillus sp. cl95]
MRIQHPMLNSCSKTTVSFSFNHVDYEGREGETIAIALWANGVKALRKSEKNNEPRGMYCGIGQCYECRIYHSQKGLLKACTTIIRDGEQYFSQEQMED